LNTLQEENATSPDVVAEMINMAQNMSDPVSKARLFGALEGVRDPSLMPTLVNGLQDANPVVRENAVEALRPFTNDPRIQEWLNFIVQNDNDPRVKREAHQALARQQQRR
jgi:HEAT repeat protein